MYLTQKQLEAERKARQTGREHLFDPMALIQYAQEHHLAHDPETAFQQRFAQEIAAEAEADRRQQALHEHFSRQTTQGVSRKDWQDSRQSAREELAGLRPSKQRDLRLAKVEEAMMGGRPTNSFGTPLDGRPANLLPSQPLNAGSRYETRFAEQSGRVFPADLETHVEGPA
jgi:hypothetical protein